MNCPAYLQHSLFCSQRCLPYSSSLGAYFTDLGLQLCPCRCSLEEAHHLQVLAVKQAFASIDILKTMRKIELAILLPADKCNYTSGRITSSVRRWRRR